MNFNKTDLSKAASVTISADYQLETFDAANYKSLVKIDASAVEGNLEIIGNDKNNSIIAGNGGSTISGGKGNDTLSGGAGEDKFIYTAGKDVIANYSADDAIEITKGKVTKTAYKGNDVIFSVGSGSITVKDGAGKNISITDSSGTQTYSRTYDLLYDSNFLTDDFALDEITEQKFDVAQIQNSDNLKEFDATDKMVIFQSDN